MPNEGVQILPVQKRENPVEIQEARWNAILDKIKKIGPSLAGEDRRVLLESVLENSIRDGLQIARVLGLSRDDVRLVTGETVFITKQGTVAAYLDSYYRKLYPNEKFSPWSGLENNIEDLVSGTVTLRANKPKEVTAITDEIDDYYAEFLKGQQMEAIETQAPDNRSEGEQKGEMYLEKIYQAIREKYYAGPVISYLYQHIPQEAKKDGLSEREAVLRYSASKSGDFRDAVKEVLGRNLLSDGDLQLLFIGSGIKLDTQKFPTYKLLNITAEVEERESTKQLVAELEQSVGGRFSGLSLEQDKETKMWKFVPGKKGEAKEQPKRNLDHLEESDFTREELEFEPLLSGTYVSFFGKNMYYATLDKAGNSFVALPNGKCTNSYKSIDSVTASNSGLGTGVVFRSTFESSDGTILGYSVFRDVGRDGDIELRSEEIELSGIIKVGNHRAFLYYDRKARRYFIRYPDGKASSLYEKITHAYDFHGELYFSARRRGEEFLVGPDGTEGISCKDINWIGEVDGELYYEAETTASARGERFFIYSHGPHSGMLSFPHKNPARDLIVSNGNFFYTTKDDHGFQDLIDVDKSESVRNGERIFDLQDIGGNSYCIIIVNDGMDYYLYSPNTRIKFGRSYDRITKLLNINDRPYYFAFENGDSFIVGPDQKEIRDFGKVSTFELKDGFVHIVAEKEGKWYHYYLEIGEFEKKAGEQKEQKDFDSKDLTPEERRKLDLLNAISTKDQVSVVTYLANYTDLKKSKPGVSKTFVATVNKALKEGKKFLLNTIPAKRDSERDMQMLAEYIFPELRQQRLRKEGGPGRGVGSIESHPEAYLMKDGEDQFGDGNPLEKGKEVMRTREPVHELIISRVLAKYNKDRGSFEEANMLIEKELGEPTHEFTFSIHDVHGLREVSLPFLLGAEIIPERVKGIMPDGREVPLKAEILPTGGARVALPDKIKGVTYSLRRSELPVVPSELGKREYEIYKRDLERKFGNQFTERVAVLPPELKLFVASIDKLQPREKIIAIEREVRRIGYYDFSNGEVQREKLGMKPGELFSFMQERMDELKRSKTGMPETFKQKTYAGVCADFNKLVLAMMREAGIPSGLIIGFNPQSEIVSTSEAHGVAYALWPGGKDGTHRVIPVDGTPGGVTEAEKRLLANIQQLSLEEKEKDYEKIAQELLKDAQLKFEEVEELLRSRDIESIRQLSNGELEKIVNILLRYGVKESHYRAIKGILDAAQYSPMNISRINLNNPEERQEFQLYAAREIRRERTQHGKDTNAAGGELFSAIEGFVKRGGPNAFDNLRQMFDIIQHDLNSLEASAFITVVNYLEAKQMTNK